MIFLNIPSDPATRDSRGNPISARSFTTAGHPRFARNVKKLLAGSLFLPIGLASALLHAQPRPIDIAKSAITINVGKSGLFSAFGHNHVVRAPIAEGAIEESGAKPSVQFRVDARELKVLDPDVKPEERAEIQRDMQGPKVLDSKKYPEIRFRSTAIERAGDARWKVSGELTLHGQTHPVQATVSGGNGRYRGTAGFKQTQFGITPVAAGGGTVKVKDELRIEFEITAQ